MSRNPLGVTTAALMALALAVPPGENEDWRDNYPEEGREKGVKKYGFATPNQSKEVMEQNKALSIEKQNKKDAEDSLLATLKKENPTATGKQLRKKLKELRKTL